jgi:hypothetical protein
VGLASSTSPAARLIFTLIFAAFWNGIVSVFLFDVIASFRGDGQRDWFGALFMVPFAAVGVGAILYFFYGLLALFNPRPHLSVSANPVRLDQGLEVDWTTTGSVNRIRAWRVTLEGREEATYTRGTTTSTDRETFAVLDIAKGAGGAGFREGGGKAVFPANAMHSFNGGHNRISWVLKVHGDVPFWPDVSEEFEIEVAPHRVGGTR